MPDHVPQALVKRAATPVLPPIVVIEELRGNSVRVRVGERHADEGVQAQVFAHLGNMPPNDIDHWRLVGSTNAAQFTFEIEAAEPGEMIWISAYWKTAHGRIGPATVPVSKRFEAQRPSVAA